MTVLIAATNEEGTMRHLTPDENFSVRVIAVCLMIAAVAWAFAWALVELIRSNTVK